MEASPTPFGLGPFENLKQFNSRAARFSFGHFHTRADPFLFCHEDSLYIFYEGQEIDGDGCIFAGRTTDLKTFEDLGLVMAGPCHLSYPQVFRVGDDIFMVPETYDAEEIALYRFSAFPRGLVHHRQLKVGMYADPTLHFENGRWWLFATSDRGLELFSASDILADEFVPHPLNPVCADPARSRCAGHIIHINGASFRPAQPAQVGDGSFFSMVRIEELTTTSYRERSHSPIFAGTKMPWQERGSHHISLATLNGRSVVAVDGRQSDLLINTLVLNPAWRLFAGLRRRFNPAAAAARRETYWPVESPSPHA